MTGEQIPVTGVEGLARQRSIVHTNGTTPIASVAVLLVYLKEQIINRVNLDQEGSKDVID